jgi:uncharacterized protein
MILEGIVTTVSPEGDINIAPMGPRLFLGSDETPEWSRFLFRPFQTARTYRNLIVHGEGVFHVTDDVLLLARAAMGRPDPMPPLRPAGIVRGWVLSDCCRYYEFRISRIDETGERAELHADVVHHGHERPFFGFNRAKHAVVEASILITRLHLIPREEVETEFRRLAVIVAKTGGPREQQAFALLSDRVAKRDSP